MASRLHSAAIHLLRRVRAADAASPLSPPRLSALSVLVFGGRRTLGDLAAAEQVRPPSMTRLVQEMAGEGLVRRRPDAADGRVVWVEATARGRRVLERARRARIDVLVRLLATVPEAEVERLGRAAEVIDRVARAEAADPPRR